MRSMKKHGKASQSSPAGRGKASNRYGVGGATNGGKGGGMGGGMGGGKKGGYHRKGVR